MITIINSHRKIVQSLFLLIAFGFFSLLSLLVQASEIRVVKPETQIEKFEKTAIDNIQLSRAGEKPLKERAISLQNAIGALNEMKRTNLIKDYSPYQKEIQEIEAQIGQFDSETAKTLSNADLSADHMKSLHEQAHAKFLLGFLLLRDGHNEKREKEYNECAQIYDKIAAHTTLDRCHGDLSLLESGSQSRLWLAILPLVTGDLNAAQENLKVLKAYLDYLQSEKISSDSINHDQWTAKQIEIETTYMFKKYGECIALTNHYFADVWKDLTPSSPETDASITALEALYTQINAMRHLQSEVKAATQDDIEYRMQIIKKAEFLASFGDSHKTKNNPMDYWVHRVDLLSFCYRDFGFRDKKYQLMSHYYYLNPNRFSEYGFAVSVYEMKKTLKNSEYHTN